MKSGEEGGCRVLLLRIQPDVHQTVCEHTEQLGRGS